MPQKPQTPTPAGELSYPGSAMGLTLYATMVLLFSLWATVHLFLCWALLRHSTRGAVFGFFFPPMAIYYAQLFPLGKLTVTWIISFAAYLVALTAGLIG